MTDSEWTLAFVLPNLQADGPNLTTLARALCLGQDGIAIVPASDDRVRDLRAKSSAADTLLGSFRSEHGEPIIPAVLIVRTDVSALLQGNLQAIVAFRNAVAISFVLPGRTQFVYDSGFRVVSWSDFFDFHPTSVSLKNSLYTDTPALRAFLIPEEGFQAMPSTGLDFTTRLGSYDPYLVRNLGRLWKERFLAPTRDRLLGRLVFRSLEMAYHAASMTNRNEASLNDFGMQVALWVTALEVLARPARGRASQHKVLALLEECQWDDVRLRQRRYTLRFRRRGRWSFERRSILPKLCNNLYQARHRFVHGDHTSIEALTPPVGQNNPALPRIAALVFRAALTARLSRRFKTRPWSIQPDIFAENVAGFEHERALLRVMGLD